MIKQSNMKIVSKRVLLLLSFIVLLTASSDALAQRNNRKSKKEAAATVKPEEKVKPIKTYESELKGFDVDEGIFKMYQKDGKLKFEIPTKELGLDMLMITRVVAVPENYSGFSPGGSKIIEQVVRWEKFNDQILLKKVSFNNVADTTDAIFKSVVDNNFSPIIGAFKIEGEPEDSTAFLIDVTNFYKKDTKAISGIAARLRTQYQVRRLDETKSYIESAKSFPINTEIRQIMTYEAGRPPSNANTGLLSVKVSQSMIKLPEDKMMPRIKDNRVGYFSLSNIDFSSDKLKGDQQTFIKRWRLEPKDKAAYARGELVEPVKPIVYYLDPATPEKFRKWFKMGIEDWQTTFESAGFKNAIIAKDAPTKEEDPDWSPEDARYSTVRYIASMVRNATGPSTADPRTGEIIESDIKWFHNHLRSYRNWYMIQTGASNPKARTLDTPEEEIGEMMRQVIAHEIGHALGLPHNMKSSSAYPVESMRDPEFTKKYGVAPTIMDYARVNYIAQPGDGVTRYIRQIGPYDHYSINWGYRYLPEANTPEEELSTLRKWIKDASNDRMLRFGGGSGANPEEQTEDLGDNSMTASAYGMENIMKVIPNLLEWTTKDGENYGDTQEIYGEVIGQWRRFAGHVVTNIGGITENLKSSDQEGAVYEVVPESQQIEAMNWMHKYAFATPDWLLDEDLLRKIEEYGAIERIRSTQASFVNRTLDPTRMQRLIEAEAFKGRNTYTIYQLVGDLRKGLFSEFNSGKEIDTYRRNIQRAYIARMEYLMTNEASSFQSRTVNVGLSDIRPVVKAELKTLNRQLKAALPKYTSRVSRIHIEDALDRIDNILNPK